MLKKITLVYSLVFVLFIIICLGELAFSNGTYSASSISSVSSDSFFYKYISANLYGFITVVISSVVITKIGESTMPKISIGISIFTVILSLLYILVLSNTEDASSFINDFVYPVYSFLNSVIKFSYYLIIPILLTISIIPSNSPSALMKKGSFIAIALNGLSCLILIIIPKIITDKSTLESLKSYLEIYSTASKFFILTLGVEAILICLAYIFNYTFDSNSNSEEESDNVDFETLKAQAEETIKNRQNNIKNAYAQMEEKKDNKQEQAQVQVQEDLSIPMQSEPQSIIQDDTQENKQEDIQVPTQTEQQLVIQDDSQENKQDEIQIPMQSEPQLIVQNAPQENESIVNQ